MSAKIKKDDPVIVLSGSKKGKIGKVLKSFPNERKVLVSGVNMIKKHQKPNRENSGKIIEKEAKISVSNIAYLDPKTNQPTRIGFKILDTGRKVRFSKKSGEVIHNWEDINDTP